RKDTAEAIVSYKKAAEQDERQALLRLGQLYAGGPLVARDDPQSVQWYRKAAEAGDAEGMRRLAIALELGRGVPRDPAKALEWYRKAAAVGDTQAAAEERRLAAQKSDPLTEARAAAEKGDPQAAFELGAAFSGGTLAPRDEMSQFTWFSK